MPAEYWIAKYVEDPLRNETRNVGIVVRLDGRIDARFVGEREDKTFDGRKIKSKFSYPNVYTQWREYWRKSLDGQDINMIIDTKTVNYFVETGGKVLDVGTDSVEEVTEFLFQLLVGGGPVEAFQWAEQDENVSLSTEIAATFEHLLLLAREGDILVRHPIVRDHPISGRHVQHRPSFSQSNGRLQIFEHIDLSVRHQNKIKERAGLLGYMFSDIKLLTPDAETFSIVMPDNDSQAEPLTYAKEVLQSESVIINWLDERERERFLEERRRIADVI